jgi:hypothetical protein
MKIKLFLVLVFVSSCNPYSGRFACNPARGMYCTSLSKVDEMITNGTIDYVDIDQKKQKKFKLKK